jgi:hypothetical protein
MTRQPLSILITHSKLHLHLHPHPPPPKVKKKLKEKFLQSGMDKNQGLQGAGQLQREALETIFEKNSNYKK